MSMAMVWWISLLVIEIKRNELVMNSGSYNESIDLPGGVIITESIAAADINRHGMVDIIICNWNQNNQRVLNSGNGSYCGKPIELMTVATSS